MKRMSVGAKCAFAIIASGVFVVSAHAQQVDLKDVDNSRVTVGQKDMKTGNIKLATGAVVPKAAISQVSKKQIETKKLEVAALKMQKPPATKLSSGAPHHGGGGVGGSGGGSACTPSCWTMSAGKSFCTGCCFPAGGTACTCWEYCYDEQSSGADQAK